MHGLGNDFVVLDATASPLDLTAEQLRFIADRHFGVGCDQILQVEVVDHGLNIAAAVTKPRLHHQWLPDEVRIERGFPADVAEGLRARGQKVIEPLGQTSANSIEVTAEGFAGAADPRTRGALAAGF